MNTNVTEYLIERIKLGLKQQDVSEGTGVSQPKLSQIERGLPPKPEEKKALDKFYNSRGN